MGVSILVFIELAFFSCCCHGFLNIFHSSAILADIVHREFLNSALVNDIQTRSPAHTVLLIFTSFIQMSHLQRSWFCRLLYFLHLCWIVTEIKYATLAHISLDVTLFSSFAICLYCCFLPKYAFFSLAAYFMSPLCIQKYVLIWHIGFYQQSFQNQQNINELFFEILIHTYTNILFLMPNSM